jgi:hypothetical protein
LCAIALRLIRWRIVKVVDEHARSLAVVDHSALDRIAPRVVSFEEPCTIIREGLAEVLEKQEDFSKAAQVLAGIDMDSGEALQYTCVRRVHAPCAN